MNIAGIYLLEQHMRETMQQRSAERDHIRYAGQARHGERRPAPFILWQIGRLRFVWAPR